MRREDRVGVADLPRTRAAPHARRPVRPRAVRGGFGSVPVVRQAKEQVIDPLGVLMPVDVAVKPNVVLPSAAIVPL